MAEGEGKNYGKLIQKNFSRTVEKMMHTIGKSDKTTDEEYMRLSANFTEQHAMAQRLQKEMKNYLLQLKAMSSASEKLYSAIKDAYDYEWRESQTFKDSIDQLHNLWNPLITEVDERCVPDLNNYCAQFPDIKTKMAKRGRKLVDFDAARHTLQNLENAKNRNDFKVTKAHDDMIAAKTVYDSLNTDLHRLLPEVYDSRIGQLCNCFNRLFQAEKDFAACNLELKAELAELSQTMAVTSPAISTTSSSKQLNNYVTNDEMVNKKGVEAEFNEGGPNYDNPTSPVSTKMDNKAINEYQQLTENEIRIEVKQSAIKNDDSSANKQQTNGSQSSSVDRPDSYAARTDPAGHESYVAGDKNSHDKTVSKEMSSNGNGVLRNNKNDDPDDAILYQVIATNPYNSEDDLDELEFEAGHVINVIPPVDPEDIDEGWLMGFNTATGKRGLFPENFTKRL